MPSTFTAPPTDIVRFTNGYLALKDGTAVKGDLYVSPSLGTIVSGQVSYFTNQLAPVRTIDLDGGILSPGLIDVQINGAYGVDFSELDPSPGGEAAYLAGLDKVSKRIVETGTTAYVPTIITQKEELYAKVSPRRMGGSTAITETCTQVSPVAPATPAKKWQIWRGSLLTPCSLSPAL